MSTPNEWSLLFDWSRRIGGEPKHGQNELHFLRQIASARGHTTTHTMNEVDALRSIAASYGKSNVGYMNELDALRATVDGTGARPSNRNLHDMNEIDCLWSIIRAGGGAYLFNYSGGDSLASATSTRSTTATYIDSAGALQTAAINVARDAHYVRDGSSLAYVRTLLVEGAGTNQHLNSKDFTGYSPTAGIVTKTANFGVAPDGTTTTTRFQVDGSIRILRFVSANCGIDAATTQYCVSLFYRGSVNGVQTISGRAGAGGLTIYLPSNGGMQRCYSVFTSGAAAALIDIETRANADFELWGIQVEKNVSVPSSYIPSAGTAGTRGADVVSLGGPSSVASRYERYYILNSQVESEVVSTVAANANLDVARAYRNVVASEGTKTISYFRSLLSLDALSPTAAAGLKWFKRDGAMFRTACWVGDSTTSNATTLFLLLTPAAGNTGRVMEGVTTLNNGENGASAAAFNANAVTHGLTDTIAVNADLYVYCYGINDVRLGACSEATLTSRIATSVDAIRAARPGSDIILRMPNSLTTDDPGATGFVTLTGLFSAMTLAQAAQAATDIMRGAYMHFVGLYPNVYVWDTQTNVFGTVCTTNVLNGKMTDILHPNATGQTAVFDNFVAILIAP